MDKQVNEIMSKRVVTVRLDDSVRTAYQIMREKGFRHLPVSDGHGAIVGILSDRDLHRAMQPNISFYLDESNVEFVSEHAAKHYMSWPVKSVHEGEAICDVAKLMLEERISAVLVESSPGNVRGIITTDDLIKLLIKMLAKDPEQRSLSIGTAFDYLGGDGGFA